MPIDGNCIQRDVRTTRSVPASTVQLSAAVGGSGRFTPKRRLSTQDAEQTSRDHRPTFTDLRFAGLTFGLSTPSLASGDTPSATGTRMTTDYLRSPAGPQVHDNRVNDLNPHSEHFLLNRLCAVRRKLRPQIGSSRAQRAAARLLLQSGTRRWRRLSSRMVASEFPATVSPAEARRARQLLRFESIGESMDDDRELVAKARRTPRSCRCMRAVAGIANFGAFPKHRQGHRSY